MVDDLVIRYLVLLLALHSQMLLWDDYPGSGCRAANGA